MQNRALLTIAALLAATACGEVETDLETVEKLEVESYLGTWYDVASFPQSFQEGCHCTTATYELKDDGDISVLNRCRKGSPEADEEEATGRAWIPDSDEPGKLKVEFFPLFAGDYWVLELGELVKGDYSYAVVANPTKEYLWILAREAAIEPELFAQITARLDELGFDLKNLKRTSHGGCPSK